MHRRQVIENERSRLLLNSPNPYPMRRLVPLAFLVCGLCYLAAEIGGALVVRPEMVSPLWLGNVLLASILVLTRRKIWPALLPAGLAGFFLFDLAVGEPIRSLVWFAVSNAIEVLIAAWFLRISFDGVPQLTNVKSLARYSFYAVFLAPFVGAFFGAFTTTGHYWATWKVAFLSEAIGFLTLMPAILGWARVIPVLPQKPRAYYLEALALLAAMAVLAYFAITAPQQSTPPVVFYSLVPLLIWSTLRFGSTGVSTSMIAVAFIAIWNAVHGRGPFIAPGPHINVFSLQMFLFFMAAPFMVLAALVEETKDVAQTLRLRDRELNDAQRVARTGSWKWDASSNTVTWSAELYRLAGYNPELPAPSFKEHKKLFTPESWSLLKQGIERAMQTGVPYKLDLEAIRSDGTRFWLTTRGEAVMDANGRPLYLRGTTQDITDRKLSEAALIAMSGRLITAQEEERSRIARELHDDLSQRLALLQISLQQFKQSMPELSSPAQQHLEIIEGLATEVSSDIRSLSHELHPAKLETLGLVASLKGLCSEFSAQHELAVEFVSSNIPDFIPKDVTLCLFRITQEALHNVVKHSGAAEAVVELSGYADEISLCIRDSGRGFDINSVAGVSGLGLNSLRERVRLVRGQLSIESKLSQGTQIHVCIPLPATNAQVAPEGKARRANA
jgi:PAS domain S-box-containing protein